MSLTPAAMDGCERIAVRRFDLYGLSAEIREAVASPSAMPQPKSKTISPSHGAAIFRILIGKHR